MQSLPSISGVSKSRLQALYSDISRQKHSNQASFHSNVEWWRNTLVEVITTNALPDTRNRLVLSANRSLVDSFRYEGVGKPLSLGCVIVRVIHWVLVSCACIT
jgi:charged multivesicular body protein 7